MKKLLCLIFALLLSSTIVFSTGCGCDFKGVEDILPSLEEYGEWDGNYMYRGNVRVKTSGEDEQLLVPEITYNGAVYPLSELIDSVSYRFFDDNTIFLFATNLKPKAEDEYPEQSNSSSNSSSESSSESEKLTNSSSENQTSSTNADQEISHSTEDELEISVLIKYLIKEKTHEIIHVFKGDGLRYYSLEKIYDNFAVFCKRPVDLCSSLVEVGILDMNKKSIVDFTANRRIVLLKDCIVLVETDRINYALYSDKEASLLSQTSLFYNDDFALSVYDSTIDGTPLVEIHHGYKQSEKIMYYFNLKTKKIYQPTFLNDEDAIVFVSDDIILKGNIELRENEFGNIKEKIVNCKLYKCSLKNDELEYEYLNSFKSKLTYDSCYAFKNGSLGFTFFSHTTPINKTDVYKYYVYNKDNNSLESIDKFDRPEINYYNSIEEISCGDYLYYYNSDKTDALMSSTSVYMLMSKNTVTGEERLMQAFVYGDDNGLYARNSIIITEDYWEYHYNVFGQDGYAHIRILPY